MKDSSVITSFKNRKSLSKPKDLNPKGSYRSRDNAENTDEDEIIEMEIFLSDPKKILTDSDRLDIMRRGTGKLTDLERLARLFQLIREDNSQEFKKLLNEDKNVINTMYKKSYLLHEACRRGMADIVTFLLFSNADCNLRDGNGMYPQHNAALSGCMILIDILSVFGHDLNIKDLNGNTPLHLAVMNKDSSIVHMLLSYNVKILKNKEEKTPIEICDDSDISDMFKYLLNGKN